MNLWLSQRISRITLALALAATSGRVLAVQDAQAQDDEQQQSPVPEHVAQTRGIEGVWAVTATIRDCQTGNPVPGVPLVRARNMFIRGGTLTEIGARGNPILRGPSFGTWYFEGNGHYRAVFRYSRFNPDGTFLATQKIARSIALSTDRSTFAANALVESFDANDNLIQTGCATEVATRLE